MSSGTLVTLVNSNKLHPPIAPYAMEVMATSLEQRGFEVDIVDLTLRRDDWKQIIDDYFAVRSPLLVGVSVRHTDSIYPQEQRVFLGDHLEIIQEIQSLTSAPLVAGGVGFSSMPFALVDYFGIEFGVKGPGELVICQLAGALARGDSPDVVPGLLINEGGGVVRFAHAGEAADDGAPLAHHLTGRVGTVNLATAYMRNGENPGPYKIDNVEYYRRGGMGNILTKSGCPYSCAHCVEPDAKGNRFALRPVSLVADEIEQLVGMGVCDLHTADSEFNLNISHSSAVLQEIIRRKMADPGSPLHNLRLWAYLQPTPFNDEFAALLAAAGCRGINIAPDHVRDDVLEGWKVTRRGSRFFTFDDVRNTVRIAHEHGLLTMLEVILGMPGETAETMRECVEKTLSLNATVSGYTLGVRVFPYTPLGMWVARQSAGARPVPGVQSNAAVSDIVVRPLGTCASYTEYERQFMFDEFGRYRPLYFFSPGLPEDPGTVSRPDGRWQRSLELLWSCVPEEERYRVMLPTPSGKNEEDHNYADNPFLVSLARLGYKGALWSYWRDRERIMQEAREAGVAVAAGI